MKSTLSNDLRSGALIYHRSPRPGKIEIQALKKGGATEPMVAAAATEGTEIAENTPDAAHVPSHYRS
ncbi:hypothetical protein [Bosea vaviloviae]|uniref:Uncharacterized protein n=1 Tax=Bosea vaviloviae TaxID=1526658 RepID=A0A1D7UCB9_9HYPH|nr:hypothetical protein [Bosea vaviloviae]AOO85020.1 hypothetical protein BHK69_30375 [Bosea vaviloviae]